jgi:hypothetical protein
LPAGSLQIVSGITICGNVAIPGCFPGHFLPYYGKRGLNLPYWKTGWLHFRETWLPVWKNRSIRGRIGPGFREVPWAGIREPLTGALRLYILGMGASHGKGIWCDPSPGPVEPAWIFEEKVRLRYRIFLKKFATVCGHFVKKSGLELVLHRLNLHGAEPDLSKQSGKVSGHFKNKL